MALLLLFTVMCLINLQRSTRSATVFMQRKQLNILAIATLIAGLTGPVALVAATFSKSLSPGLASRLLLGTAVILLGIGVARYSAISEGRTIRRDFVLQRHRDGVDYLLFIYWSPGYLPRYLTSLGEVYIFIVLLASRSLIH